MDESRRWAITAVAVLAIVALLLFARGTPDHGDTDATPVPIGAVVSS
jgi:hypothetical protein